MELFSGGTEVTVHGSNLDSVAQPRITLTVITTTWLYNDTNVTSSTNETSQEVIVKSFVNELIDINLKLYR